MMFKCWICVNFSAFICTTYSLLVTSPIQPHLRLFVNLQVAQSLQMQIDKQMLIFLLKHSKPSTYTPVVFGILDKVR